MGFLNGSVPGASSQPRSGVQPFVIVIAAAATGVLALFALAIGISSAVAMSGERDALSAELDDLRTRTASARREVAEATERSISVKSELAASTTALEEAKGTRAKIMQELEAARTVLSDVEAKAAAASEVAGDLDDRRERLKQVDADLQRVESARIAVGKTVAEQEATVASNLERMKTIGRKLAESESTIRQAADLASQIAAQRSELDRLRKEADAASVQLKSAQEQFRATQEQLAAADGRLKGTAAMDEEIEQKAKKIGELGAQLRAAQLDQASIARLREERDRLQAEIERLGALRQQAEQAMSALNASDRLAKQLEDAMTRLASMINRMPAASAQPPASSAPSTGGTSR